MLMIIIHGRHRIIGSEMMGERADARAGIRAPGGFANGLVGRPDIQALIKECGFNWISAKYPAHKVG